MAVQLNMIIVEIRIGRKGFRRAMLFQSDIWSPGDAEGLQLCAFNGGGTWGGRVFAFCDERKERNVSTEEQSKETRHVIQHRKCFLKSLDILCSFLFSV